MNLDSAEPSQQLENRGRLQRPQTASESKSSIPPEPDVRQFDRVLTVKLERLDKNWKILREIAAEAAVYANHYIDALWAQSRGYTPPDKELNATRDARRKYKGRLSGAAYSGIERVASAAWAKASRQALSGWQGTPRFSNKDALHIRWDGAKIFIDDKGCYVLDLRILASGEGERFLLPVMINKARDRFQGVMLDSFVDGSVRITKVVLNFRPKKGGTYARISYKRSMAVPPMGDRVATLGPIEDNRDRLTLRTDFHTLDFSRKLRTVRTKKDELDKAARRYRYRIGRSKGSSRLLRRKLAEVADFTSWCKNYSHTWTRQTIDWCAKVGVGRLIILPISDGDWPAWDFVRMLKYKGAESGIEVVEQEEADLDLVDASSYRAVSGPAKKQARRASKVRQAARTIMNAEFT